MTSKQNAREIAVNKMQTGELTAAQANVLMVQMEGVRVVRNKLPRELRKAFNDAVKAGELGHIKKEGLKPEVYHHKNARPKALDIRDSEFRSKVKNLSGVFGGDPLF